MSDKHSISPRSRASRAGRRKPARPAQTRSETADRLRDRAALTLKIASLGLFILAIYLICCITTAWTGTLGRAARAMMTSLFGGAVVIPLAYGAYVCLSIVIGRRVPQPVRHTLGTALMYLCGALLLGLISLAYGARPAAPLLEPGLVGTAAANWSWSSIGALGTTLLGFGGACLTLYCFGFTSPFLAMAARVKILASWIASKFARRAAPHAAPSRGEAEGDEPASDEQEQVEEEPQLDAQEEYERELERKGEDFMRSIMGEADDVPQAEPDLQTTHGKYQYVNEPDEVIKARSRALHEHARELAKAKEEEDARDRRHYEEAYAIHTQQREPLPLPEPEPGPLPEPTPEPTPSPLPEPAHEVRPEPAAPPEPEPEHLPEPERYSESDILKMTAHEPEPARELGSEPAPKNLAEQGYAPSLPTPVEVVAVDEVEYDDSVRMAKGKFPPPVEIYGEETDFDAGITQDVARPWGDQIIQSLGEFGIEAELSEILIGPTVIQFRIQPLPGVKVNKIVALANDLALALAVKSLRIEAPIPGMPYVGIEIPNPKRRGITLRSVIEDAHFSLSEKTLPLPMGVTINGESLVVGLEDLPHMLVAGTTGSGKSVFVNGCIVGLCSKRRPDELKMMLIDPKMVEMAVYEELPHLLTPPITEAKKAVGALAWAVREMENRYSLCKAIRVRNIATYNETVLPKDRMPHIVIVIDELADLMMTAAKEVEELICRIAQKARAVGIHLVLATQRPSVDVITGLIKANVPARVAFTVPSLTDSRTIIDSPGAEKLLGKGDMLFLSTTQAPKPIRIQSPWIDEKAIEKWLAYLTSIFGAPEFTDIDEQGEGPGGGADKGDFDDELFEDAVRCVLSSGMASASGLQRRLRVGFTRAGRLVDMMEAAGIIGPADGARPRDILVDEEGAEIILERYRG